MTVPSLSFISAPILVLFLVSFKIFVSVLFLVSVPITVSVRVSILTILSREGGAKNKGVQKWFYRLDLKT